MKIVQLLRQHAGDIVDEASKALRSRVKRFEDVEVLQRTTQRYRKVFDLIVESIAKRDVGPLLTWSKELAERQFSAGHDLSEVQTAINALEEALWKRLLDVLDPSEFAKAIGAVSTVLGLSKDMIARTYVSLASHQRAPSLDMSRLFSGTQLGDTDTLDES